MHLLPCRIINQFELRENETSSEREKRIKNTQDQDGDGGDRHGAERLVGFQCCKSKSPSAGFNNRCLWIIDIKCQAIKCRKLCCCMVVITKGRC